MFARLSLEIFIVFTICSENCLAESLKQNVKFIIKIKIFKLGLKLAYQIIFCREKERLDINTQLCSQKHFNKEKEIKIKITNENI